MNRILEYLIDNQNARRIYFNDLKDETCHRNFLVLHCVNICSMFLFVIFILISPKIITSWHITKEYFYFIPLFVIYFIFTSLYYKKNKKNYYVVQVSCAIYCICLVSCIIGIDVFSYKESPSIFFQLIIIGLPIIFKFRLKYVYMFTLLCEGCYVYLVEKFKVGYIAQNDIFCSIVGVLFSFIVAWIISDLRARDANARMTYKRLSITDTFTGLLNKESCERYARQEIEKDNDSQCSALIMMDIDDFKTINDRFGHKIGDSALKKTGTEILRNFSNGCVSGRIGGDEFLVYVKDASNTVEIEKRCVQLREKINNDIRNEHCIHITISMGIILFSGNRDFNALFKEADNLLYKAKKEGKNKYIIKEI